MLASAIKDEPSMEAILAEVRRILAEEEAARAPRPALRHDDTPLVLTNMIAADGSVVSIAPSTKAYVALRPMARRTDPFAEIDELRQRVSDLVDPEPKTPRMGRGAGPKPRLTLGRPAAEMVTVDVATLCQTPILVPGVPADLTGVDSHCTETRSPVGFEPADMSMAPSAGVAPRADRSLDPVAEIERMLAQQMAMAHHAAMTLTGAAVDRLHAADGRADDQHRAGARARGRIRVLGRRHRSDTAARLADTATRMMEAYNNALDTLMALRGGAAKSIAPHKRKVRKRGRAAPAKNPRGASARSARGRKRPANRGKRRGKPKQSTARGK